MVAVSILLLGNSVALDAKVLVPCERTFVIDLGDEYGIEKGSVDASSGILMENFTIQGENGRAEAVVFTPYDELLKMISKESFVDIFSVALLMEATKEGHETGNWTATSFYGAPVLVHNITFTSGTFAGSEAYLAVWDPGDTSYIMLLSAFDGNTTSKIIESARII